MNQRYIIAISAMNVFNVVEQFSLQSFKVRKVQLRKQLAGI